MLTRWFDDDVLSRFNQMQREMDRLWSALRPFETEAAGVFPPMNIYDDGESSVARAELPGVDPRDVDVTVTGNTLHIRGKREIEPAGGNVSYHRRERKAGTFSRAFELPAEVEADKVTASCNHGVLEVLMPRTEQSQRKKIEVTTQ